MTVQQARVPVLDETGRFPDAYAPPSVAANTAAAQEARTGAETARTGAITAQGKAEDAQQGAEQALAGVPAAVDGALAPQVQAAQTAANDAGTARNQAETFAGQAQTSAGNAAGSATEAQEYAQVGRFIYDPRGDVSGTLDLSSVTTQNFVHARLTGNLTVILPTSPQVGQTVTLVLRQDATGGRTLIVNGGPTAYSVPITLSAATNARDLIHLMWDGVDWNVLVGGLSMGVAAGWMVA